MADFNGKFWDVLSKHSKTDKRGYEMLNEWIVTGIIFVQPDFCICGHPIIENCEIRNRDTGDSLIVGNCCVKRWWNIDQKNKFTQLDKIKNDAYACVNKDFALEVRFEYTGDIINNWELGFLLDMFRKRKRSFKQREIIKRINLKILKYFNNMKRIQEAEEL